jgi:tRNA nucleotidyltransferase (CCA-adding enzyme)
MGVHERDKDYVVTGVTESAFNAAFPGAFKAGGRFPVYRLEIAQRARDVSLARNETKTGRGYRGFEATPSPLMTIEGDLGRRDSTINAMAVDLETGELIDPYGGLGDLQNGIIRAVSERFADDPVRALRAARQAAQFGFRIEPRTVLLMARCHDELACEPAERLVNELRLALSCREPSAFFAYLDAAGLLDVTYPAVNAPIRVGPAALSSRLEILERLDRAATLTERPEIRFAALAHGTVPEWNPLSGKLPRLWLRCAIFAESWSETAFEANNPDGIRELMERLASHPIGPDGFGTVILSIDGRVPPVLQMAREIESAIRGVKAANAPHGLSGKHLGAWIKERRNSAVAEIMERLA